MHLDGCYFHNPKYEYLFKHASIPNDQMEIMNQNLNNLNAEVIETYGELNASYRYDEESLDDMLRYDFWKWDNTGNGRRQKGSRGMKRKPASQSNSSRKTHKSKKSNMKNNKRR